MKRFLMLGTLGLLALGAALSQNGVGQVSSLTLIDADADEPIKAFNPMVQNASINLNVLPSKLLNIQANVAGTVGSVRFELNGKVMRTDNGKPFALAGDTGGDFLEWQPAQGNYKLVATPFAQSNGGGAAGQPYTLDFKVVALDSSDAALNLTDPNDWQIPTYIFVDQFGYRPQDTKVAVISDPQQGFNAADSYTPAQTLELRRASDDSVAFTGKPTPWNNLAVQGSSGDRGWWLDFTKFQEPGTYYVFDPEKKLKSDTFEIAQDVYRKLLKTAMRMFYYNRANAAKKAPFADPLWTDDAAFVGPGQDTEARLVTAKNDASTARDLTGGWWDAGDQNKYVTFAQIPVHVLLTAFEQSPKAFLDDYNIPESGNGLPDLIDELKNEFDWMKKMQLDDGGVLLKVGYITYDLKFPPSKDGQRRYYAPACSSSSITASSMFAHAALVFAKIPQLKTYADDLKARAVKAWDWYEKNPKATDCDSQEIKSGDADMSIADQKARAAVASVYLYALTGEKRFDDGVRANMDSTRPMTEDRWSAYDSDQGDALLYYTTLPKASSDIKNRILDRKTSQASSADFYGFKPENDLYRAYLRTDSYHWGSNMIRAGFGTTNMDMVHYGLDKPKHNSYRLRGLETLHYFHGVNPMGLVYLSNMKGDGAERSVSSFWHDWFKPGTKYGNSKDGVGPPPGYLVGGPNKGYTGSYANVANQPAQKAYKDSNDTASDGKGYPWELSEPAIYYQATYIRLLANFVGSDNLETTLEYGGN
jgi:endoglucanase